MLWEAVSQLQFVLQGPFWSPQQQMSSAQPELIKNISVLRISVVFSKEALSKVSLQKQSWGPEEQGVDVKQQCVLTPGKAGGMLGCISWGAAVQLRALALCSPLVSA